MSEGSNTFSQPLLSVNDESLCPQVELPLRNGAPPLVRGVATQGRHARGAGVEYTPGYRLMYRQRREGGGGSGNLGDWKEYHGPRWKNQVSQVFCVKRYG